MNNDSDNNSENNSENDSELIELYLPESKITSEFAGKKTSDKVKIIELGLSLFKSGTDIMQFWNNNEWQEKISSLEKCLNTEKEKNVAERIELKKTIQIQTENNYNLKIENLNKYISELEERNKGTMAQMQDMYNTIDSKFESRLSDKLKQEQDKYEERIKDIQTKLDSSREQFEGLLCRTNNSTFKGQDGETLLDKQLTLMFPKAEIEDTSQQSGRGDFIMKEDDFVIMFENKNYSKNVQKSEIDKFYRDLERESNNDIQCAVFISMNTGICNRDDFSFEVINKKPILFIHKLKNNMSCLRLAVNFFKNILSLKDLDLTNKEIICAFKNVCSNIKRNFSKQKARLDKYHSEQLELIGQQENSVVELFNIVGVKY
tara:strand:+ start:999 stop:2123 length:1125 start_codon:yes stop_codon:yes gene_type:complete